MHKDMHYAGTYALAKLAGLNDAAALKIGTSAQFVDDAGEDIAILDEKTGCLLASEVSARYTAPIKYALGGQRIFLLDHIDQLNIWVPFHFLPGGKGKTLTQKLVCQTDSEIAREMIANHLKKAVALKNKGHEWGPYLIGVAAHVYADTFAHYGFSGVSSRRNLVKATSIRQISGVGKDWLKSVAAFRKKWGYLYPNIKERALSGFGELSTKTEKGTMGHPGVGSMPDHPYLRYSFQYERGDLLHGGQPTAPRDNPETYLSGCEKLHKYFTDYVAQSGEEVDGKTRKDFLAVKSQIAEILALEETDAEKREEHWRKKARELWGIKIPEYRGEKWMNHFRGIKTRKRALASDAYRFFMAAAWHKKTVLDKILPKHGINIECRQFRIDSGGFSEKD